MTYKDSVQGVTHEEYLSWLRTASRAIELPDIRIWMLDQWRHKRFSWLTAALKHHDGDITEGILKNLEKLESDGDRPVDPEFDFDALARARLFYATSDVCGIVRRRWEEFSNEYRLTGDVLPHPCGLAYFESPLHTPFGGLQLRALLWAPLGDGIRISPYMEQTMEDGAQLMWPQPSSFWTWGGNVETVTFATGAYLDEDYSDIAELRETEAAQFMTAIRRWLGTFLLVVNAPRLIDEIICHPARAVKRRSDREQLSLDSVVRVIDVHAPKYVSSTTEEGEGRRIEYSCRFPVHEFYRWQPCGPNNSERRYQLIPEYVKGPKDKPFRDSDRVFRVRKKNVDTKDI